MTTTTKKKRVKGPIRSSLHPKWQNTLESTGKLSMYTVNPRATSKQIIQRDMVKNSIDELRWNPKNVFKIQKKAQKMKQRNETQSKQIKNKN